MSEIVTLELREQDSYNNSANGDYTINLSKPISISEGDEIELFKAFIDTKEENTGRIIFQNDINIRFDYGYWQNNWDETDKDYSATSGTAHPVLDGDIYILNKHLNTGYEVIESISYTEEDYNPGESFGGMSVEYEYLDITDNQTKHITFTFPRENKRITNITTVTANLKVGLSSFARITPDNVLEAANCNPSSQKINKSSPVVGQDTTVPIIHTHNITVEAGEYLPEKLAEIITDKLTFNDLNNITTEPINSPFCFATTAADFGDLPSLNKNVFINRNGTKAYNYNTARTNQYWVGTSQLALEYLEVGRFQITYSHMPYYASSGSQAVSFIQKKDSDGNPILNQYFASLGNGGIWFQNISTVDTVTGDKIELFNKIMGFDYSKLLVQPKGNQDLNILGIGQVKGYTFNDVEYGKNITTGESSIDVGILKVQSGQTLKFNQVTIPSNMPDSTINLTQPIDAGTAYGAKSTINSGYFLIEINTNYNTNYITQLDTTGLIKGVVSRYYEANAYTSAENDASLSYIHRGETCYLSNFNIRILGPDKELSSQIGDDNTIFLNIIKK